MTPLSFQFGAVRGTHVGTLWQVPQWTTPQKYGISIGE